MADDKGQKSTKMDKNTTNASSSNNSSTDGCSSYDGYSYHPQGDGQALCQQYESYEERGCWRKLYDYQTGHWYYQNLWTNTTQWMAPVGWETWPLNINHRQESMTTDSETTGLLKFRKTSEELERKNAEYMKRPAKRQMEPEEAKKLHWRPEGANEYNIWYDRWIGDHWKGTRDDGTVGS